MFVPASGGQLHCCVQLGKINQILMNFVFKISVSFFYRYTIYVCK